jgi:hypothetical protein
VKAVKRAERLGLLVYPAVIGLGVAIFASCAKESSSPPVPRAVAIAPSPAPLPAPRKPRVFPLPERKPSPPENVANLPPSGTEAATLAAPESQPPVPAAPEPEPPTLDRSRLIGLDQPEAQRLLGTATEQSDAPPASIWRYRTASCELDLFFYLDLRSGKMRALHYVFKGEQGGSEDCLRSVLAARSN